MITSSIIPILHRGDSCVGFCCIFSPGKPVFLQRLSIRERRMSAHARSCAGGAVQRCGQSSGRGAVGSHQTSRGSRAAGQPGGSTMEHIYNCLLDWMLEGMIRDLGSWHGNMRTSFYRDKFSWQLGQSCPHYTTLKTYCWLVVWNINFIFPEILGC